MTFAEHNHRIVEPIMEILTELKKEHDVWTSSSKIMDDVAWNAYITDMNNISKKWKDTTLYNIAEYMKQYFLDDTEYIQKRLRGLNDKL